MRAFGVGKIRVALAAVGPGVLVAATGVGAGDLLTAGLGGSAVGLVILWAAAAGAVLKWFLNEGLARWQMATGTTLLEGWITHLGAWVQWVFLVYLLIWSVFTGGALVSACGVAGTGLLALTDNPQTSKIIWGVVHSLAGLILVRVGGFKLFERLMGVCIGVMFVTVILTALLIRPDWAAVGRGLVTPTIPKDAVPWVLGILGGVGGTVTLLSYGYWIRERGRDGESGLRACRLDLALGYSMTALFGISMVIIGSRVDIGRREGGLASVAIDLADQLGAVLGPAGKSIFLIGFWGAVFSSLLGVWQSVPYLFADFLSIRHGLSAEARRSLDFSKTRGYRVYLFALALLPLPLLGVSLKTTQLLYAVLGSMFMPLLALTLLIMNNRTAWVSQRFRSGWITNTILTATLVFFAYVAATTAVAKYREVRKAVEAVAPLTATGSDLRGLRATSRQRGSTFGSLTGPQVAHGLKIVVTLAACAADIRFDTPGGALTPHTHRYGLTLNATRAA